MKKLFYAVAIAALLYGVSGCRSVKKAESVSRHADYSIADTVIVHTDLMSLSDSLRMVATDSVSSAANCLLRFKEDGGELRIAPDGEAVISGLKSIDMGLQNVSSFKNHVLMAADGERVVEDLQADCRVESVSSEVSDKETVTRSNSDCRYLSVCIFVLVAALFAFMLYRRLKK